MGILKSFQKHRRNLWDLVQGREYSDLTVKAWSIKDKKADELDFNNNRLLLFETL